MTRTNGTGDLDVSSQFDQLFPPEFLVPPCLRSSVVSTRRVCDMKVRVMPVWPPNNPQTDR
jgi:hypothetical protein